MKITWTILIVAALACHAQGDMRPFIPWSQSTVEMPRRFDTALVSITVPPPDHSAPVAAKPSAPRLVSAAGKARTTLPTKLATQAISESEFVGLILACEDDAAMKQLLTDMGLTLMDSPKVRELPEFTTALGYAPAGQFTDPEAADLEKIDAPGGVRLVRYVAGSDAVVQYVAAHDTERFIVVADVHSLTAAALKSLAGGNILAIVVGHYMAADIPPEEFLPAAQETLRVTKAIRLVSDAPVLLAVSASSLVTKRTEKGWPAAFGDSLASFDGWAVYNMHNWAAVLEAPSNPRKAVLAALGLDEKPCILLDFLGTPSDWPPARADYIRSVWKAKAPLLMKTLKDQGWRGVSFHTTGLDDARLKAAVLGELTK